MIDKPISSLYDPKEYFARTNDSTNLIEIVSITTGQVVQVLGEITKVMEMPSEFVEIERADGSKILVQKGIDLDTVRLPKNQMPYSTTLASIYCEHVANGKLPTKACLIPGMPSYSTIRHWRNKYPEFKEMFEEAIKDRALFLADQGHEIVMAEEGLSSESVAASKLKSDYLKWEAEKSNPDRYGSKVKVTGDVKHHVMMVIETGVRKPGDPGFFQDETKKIRDAIDANAVKTLAQGEEEK